MKNNLKQYKDEEIPCPFLSSGCKETSSNVEGMRQHIIKDIYFHSNILFDTVNGMKSKVELLKENIEEVTSEIRKLKENERIMEKHQEENKKEILRLKRENEIQFKEMNELQNQRRQIEQKYIQKENNNKSFSSVNEVTQVQKHSDEKDKLIKDMISKINKLESQIKNLEMCKEVYNYGQYLWCIDNWSDRLKEAQSGVKDNIYSDSFYSHRNGYKMCLQIFPNGNGVNKGKCISLYFRLMLGLFDDILKWPFKHDVTLELISQESGLTHISQIVQSDILSNSNSRNRPINERNGGIGITDFVELNNFTNNNAFVKNNKIFIRCRVKLPSNEIESEYKEILDKNILNLNKKTKDMENDIVKQITIQEVQNYGEFVWIIDNWSDKLNQAKSGIQTNIYSDAFYSHRNGYKLRLQIFPNGHETGKGTHLSTFFNIMKDRSVSHQLQFADF